ncbi:MAG: hypothetical protein HY097_06385 [Nitrospinae bacterium]|nr:hypothetical protein [Nitrospinota bacterium]
MGFHNGSEEDIERLSKAIVDAIVRSKEVRSALARLIEKDVLLDKGFMVLMIKMQALAELAGFIEKSARGKRRARKKDEPQYIDGRELTPNEVAFLEYCAKKFNEKEWLKKAGIALEDT